MVFRKSEKYPFIAVLYVVLRSSSHFFMIRAYEKYQNKRKDYYSGKVFFNDKKQGIDDCFGELPPKEAEQAIDALFPETMPCKTSTGSRKISARSFENCFCNDEQLLKFGRDFVSSTITH